MGEHKGSTIGAKVLHEKEIEQSLPTYGKLKEQIEAVRLSAKAYKISQEKAQYEQDEFVLPQVINNFSILGSRGTGKSSILKTLYQHLKAENAQGNNFKNQRNILLPTIVPENLVENISLMGYILGLLKKFVDQICESHKHRNSLCQPEQHPLGKQYIQLMREFVQLQRPYEEISVQQFSNNSEYVRVMTDILKAGNQFAIRFRQFIDKLVSEYSDDALLFIFIDDIDLSTNRCGDLVKTLLSYLSHPSIVTILAGDISIFGEALTLDFLRQEKIPDTAFLENSYLVEKSRYDGDEGKMLGRKKQLAYEYLKKVMPPNNRHVIVNWSLASKKNFCFIQTDETQKGQKIETLAVLLQRLEQHIPRLKHYFVNAPYTDKTYPMGEGKQATLLYYSFDTTARGLVSGYHAIRLLVEKMDAIQASKGTVALEEVYPDIKFLIESLVAANYQLSVNRELIFGQFVELGTTLENSTVRFDNYSIWLMKQIPYFKLSENTKDSKDFLDALPENADIQLEIRLFQIFVFLDLVANLLGKRELILDKKYVQLKQNMLYLLCVNGYISEGNLCLNKQERTQFFEILQRGNENKSNILQGYYDLPFPAAVRYFRTLDISFFLDVTNEKQKEITYEVYVAYAVDYIRTLRAFYGNNVPELGLYLMKHQKILAFLEKMLNYDKKNLFLSVLCREYFYHHSSLYKHYIVSGCADSFEASGLEVEFDLEEIPTGYLYEHIVEIIPDTVQKYINNLLFDLELIHSNCWKNYIYHDWLDFVIESSNSDKLTPFYNMYQIYTEKFFDRNSQLTKLNQYSDDELKKIAADHNQQVEIIRKIDDKNLWDIDDQFSGEENYISFIRRYITAQLELLEAKTLEIIEGIEPELRIQVSDVKTEYDALKNTYAGVSDTLAVRCRRYIVTVLGERPFEKPITTSQYIACIVLLNRLIYSTAWYGKDEARHVKEKLLACKCGIFDYVKNNSNGDWLLKQYFFWLHCYCRYQLFHLSEGTHGVLQCAEHAMQYVKESLQKSDEAYRRDYINTLAEKLEMEISEVEKIPQLFESPKKKERTNDNTWY